jgi:hypothetical protein
MKDMMISFLAAISFFVVMPAVFSFTSWWISFLFGYDVGFWAAAFMTLLTAAVASVTYEVIAADKVNK